MLFSAFERDSKVCEDRRQCGGLASVGLCPESMPTVVVAPRLAAHDAEKRRRELLVVIGPDVQGRRGEGQGHARAVEVGGFASGVNRVRISSLRSVSRPVPRPFLMAAAGNLVPMMWTTAPMIQRCGAGRADVNEPPSPLVAIALEASPRAG